MRIIKGSSSKYCEIRILSKFLIGSLSIGDKDIDLEFWDGKEKVDGICSVGCQQ